jgi:hypothetical protein
MPWFQTPASLGGTGGSSWGWHWTMNTRNPNIVDPNGQREIASNYYPLIGPYDSSDPYVIEYHMLLMKLSGVDGTILDWYGSAGSNGDINSLLSASNTIIGDTNTYGLKVGVCLEDRFARTTSDVTTNINYAAQHYFGMSNYIKVGASNTPLMPLFGPINETSPSNWTTIMSGVTQKPDMVPLQYQASQVGSYATGEMGWIYQDQGTTDHLTVQKNFLQNEAGKFTTSLGDAYPGYNDYYQQGGAGNGAGFTIPSNNGATLAATLAQDQTYSANINAIQIATFNDFGEGTQIEPTVQDGFTDLQKLQQFTGVSYGLSQLQLVYQLYETRAQFKGNSTVEAILNNTANDINGLDFPDAQSTLASAVASSTATISTLNTLTLNGTAGFDLSNQQLFVTYSAGSDPVTTIRSYLASGYNNGAWNGLGINSSSAATNSGYGVGYVDGADGITGVSTGQIEIKYTLLGDVNLDGVVNGVDFGILAANFNQGVARWDAGDFNYDGAVNGIDFGYLAANFNKGASGGSGVSAAEIAALDAFAAANGLLADVPEPVALPVVAAGAIFLRRRRRN